MPNKTLYVKDSDLPLWERAQKELGASVSALFVDCLRQRLYDKERDASAPEKMEKLTITMWDSHEQPTISKSFTGRWLVNDLAPEQDDSGVTWGHHNRYSVAQTAKGAIAVYETDEQENDAPSFTVHDDFEEMKNATVEGAGYPMYPENVVAETAAALGVPYEVELDI